MDFISFNLFYYLITIHLVHISNYYSFKYSNAIIINIKSFFNLRINYINIRIIYHLQNFNLIYFQIFCNTIIF